VALTLTDATYRYAGVAEPALSGISLEIGPGSVVGVVGANGAGKSTLCLVAAGLAPATIGGHLKGSVAIDGLTSVGSRPHDLAQRCGILFQNAETQLSGTAATVWEEVAFGPRNLALPLDEVVDRSESALAALGIEELASRDPGRLSGGQAQLVALAAVLAMRPAYLVLDEPTSQLDPQGTLLVGGALQRLAREARTGLLVVEHKTDLLAGIAEECLVLAEGRIVARGPAAEVLAGPRLEEWGVEAPAAVRIGRAAESSGLRGPLLAALMAAS